MATIHHEIVVNASPDRVYQALTDSKHFSAMSGGAPAEIAADAGGAFSVFGGAIHGRNLELVPDTRVVQAWRPGSWEPGLYSIARFELQGQGDSTKIVFNHTGYPEEYGEHLAKGWQDHYWGPLEKYLG